jgi:hypothetical protein
MAVLPSCIHNARQTVKGGDRHKKVGALRALVDTLTPALGLPRFTGYSLEGRGRAFSFRFGVAALLSVCVLALLLVPSVDC